MVFYLDEQLPRTVAKALDILESHYGENRVLSTESEFGKGVKDEELFKRLKNVGGILITHDYKMVTRKNEFTIIKELGVSVFIISLPSGANYELQYKTIIGRWSEIKMLAKKHRSSSFVCRLKMRGETEFV